MSNEIELTRRAEKEILKLDAAMFEQIGAVQDATRRILVHRVTDLPAPLP